MNAAGHAATLAFGAAVVVGVHTGIGRIVEVALERGVPKRDVAIALVGVGVLGTYLAVLWGKA